MGRMGKPQKSKKHKKIKAVDPFYVGPRVADRKASVINQVPKDDKDDSYLPGSVQEIAKLRRQASKVPKKRKRNKFKKDEIPDFNQDPLYKVKSKGMSRPLKSVPNFKQKDGESEIAFMYRMDRETQVVIRRAQIEDKYNVDIEETADGETKVKKVKLLEDEESETRKNKTKNEKKSEKRKNKQMSKLKDEIESFGEFEDKVSFGEVAMAPPTITAQPRGKTAIAKKGRVQSLMLTDMLPKTTGPKEQSKRAKGQVLKRKHMSLAQQRIMDAEREKAINSYRKMKKQKKGD